MLLVTKIFLVVLALAVVAFGVAFGVSRYLVSKPDGRGTPAQTASLERYSSEDGIAFQYPNTYELSSHTQGNAERQWDTLVLLPKGYVPPQGGEGPPAISLSVFSNPEHLSLEQWVRGDARSNFKLAGNPALASTTVGGEPAVAYQHSGLYETDAVVVAHKGKIFLFEGGWANADAPIRGDFQSLLQAVQFTL